MMTERTRDGQTVSEARLISFATFAEMIGTSIPTARRLEIMGKTPKPIRFSRRLVRFDRLEVETWLDAGAPDRGRWETMRSK